MTLNQQDFKIAELNRCDSLEDEAQRDTTSRGWKFPLNNLSVKGFNPLAAKLFNWNFHPLEIVSRWRDPQLQVSENHSDLEVKQFQILLINVTFYLYQV